MPDPRKPRKPPRGPEKSASLKPLAQPRALDLAKPVSEELSPAELKEMTEHLAFLRQHRAALRLSLNATEDLLVNGARAPTDRGQCKHLLSKVDRRCVESALAREPLKGDVVLRTKFLAGVVRIQPEVTNLLWYLDSLALVADRQEAAAAFSLTIERIDFSEISNAQMATLLEVIARTFQGHERVQVLFGLLGSGTFARAVDKSLPSLPPELSSIFAPLRAAHRCVIKRGRPESAKDLADVEAGVAMLLSAPERLIKGYSAEIRLRLAEYAVEDTKGPARLLLDSLRQDDAFPDLALRHADRLLVEGLEDRARALLNVLRGAHPDLAPAANRLAALAWPRVGRLAVEPARGDRSSRLARAYWLERATFAWARVGGPDLALETEIQRAMTFPGVLPVLGEGRGDDGRVFVALQPLGRVVEGPWAGRLTLHPMLAFTAEIARILATLADHGCLLPDASLWRFVTDAQEGWPHVQLANFEKAARQPPDACRQAHGVHAERLWRYLLVNPKSPGTRGVPASLVAALNRATTLDNLVAVLTRATAATWEPATSPPSSEAR